MAQKVVPTSPGTGKDLNLGLQDFNDNFTELYTDKLWIPSVETQTPDFILALEAGQERYVQQVYYNVFLQTIRNQVTVTQTTGTITNPDFGTNTLQPSDMLVGKSYSGQILGWIQTPDSTTHRLEFQLGSGIFSFQLPQFDATIRKPFKVDFNLDFLDGTDSARNIIFSGMITTTNNIKIFDTFGSSDVKTINATGATTLDIRYVGAFAGQEIVVNRISLNRNR